MNRMIHDVIRDTWLVLFSVFIAASISRAQEQAVPASDKSKYTLFNRTPEQEMRELSTDRPDQTESPYTVDAGHFQLEMDFVSATWDRDHDRGGDLRTTEFNIAPVNLKVGLLNNVDFQLILDTYTHSRVEDRTAGTVDRASGFGDVTTRLKVNFWGNDGGTTAFGIMPFVKWPLPASGLRNGHVEGGVIFPLQVNIAEGWDLGAMTEFDFVANDRDRYDTEFVNSVTVGHDLSQRWGMYLEFYTVAGSAPRFRWQGQADVGWTYLVRKNIQLDCGCNFGVTASAPDFGPFTGLSIRF